MGPPTLGPGVLATVGHGRLGGEALGSLLAGAGVALVVDVRRFPASRSNPEVARDALAASLPRVGVAYRWDERLGGRRRLARDEPVLDPWWTVEQFRGYAAHTRTPAFRAGLAELLDDVGRTRTAVLCSETVWWRCHRRLVADVAVLGHATPVEHLMHDGRLRPHRPSPGARLGDDGVVWDVVDTAG